MSQNDDAVDIQPRETKATPVNAGAPVEHPALSQLGATFAERAAAAKKTTSKQVDDDDTEDKSVKSASTKSRRKS